MQEKFISFTKRSAIASEFRFSAKLFITFGLHMTWTGTCVLAHGVHHFQALGSEGTVMGMTCKATIRLICEYLEGRLAPEVAGEVQRHVSYCNNCRTVFDAAALTLEVYFDREIEPVSVDRSHVA